jgi:hypothetical protein
LSYVCTLRSVGHDSHSGVCEIVLTPSFGFVKIEP